MTIWGPCAGVTAWSRDTYELCVTGRASTLEVLHVVTTRRNLA